MKKSISKVLMLIFAVVLVTSSLGTTMAFAADTTLVLDSGAITITAAAPTAAGAAQITVTQGGTSTTLTADANGNTVNVKQLNPLIAATPNTITVNAGVNVNIKFITAVNIAAPAGKSALTIGAGSAVNLASAFPITLSNVFGSGGILNANSGALTVNNGISGCTLNANGAALTVNGGISSVLKNVAPTLNVTGGTLALGSGAVTVPVNVSKTGSLSVNGASISSAVAISGGTLTLSSGSITGAVTLNGGNLTIASGATPPANLTVNGGTYTNGGTNYKQVTVTLPHLPNPVSDVTYKYGTTTSTAKTVGGKFTANLPSTTTSFAAKANGIDYEITVAGTTATAKAKATLQSPADINNKYTGTSFENLNLPKTVTAILGNKTVVTVNNVEWISTGYLPYSTINQTITSKTLTPPADIILDPTTTTATMKVKLIYRSSGGGSSESQANPEYDFWRGVLSDVENASSGDTIYAYANSYSNMPSTILETLKGKKITLIITRKNGNDIKIYGKNIRTLESGRITYSMAQLAELFKNGGTSSESASSSSKIPTTAPSTAPSTYVPPATNNTPPATTVKPSSSSSSSEESAASPEEVEPSSSEEEFEPSEPEVVPTDQPIEVTPKKKLSPLSIAIIVTVGAAILSGIVACIVLQRRNKHDQF